MDTKPFTNLIDQLLEDPTDDYPSPAAKASPQQVEGCDGLSESSQQDHDHDHHTNSPSHSVAISHQSTSSPAEIADDLPTKVCTFHLNGLKGIGQGCLRVNCTYFHGTEEQLAELRQRAAYEREHGCPEGCHSTVKRVKKSLVDSDLGDKRAIVCLAYLSNTCRRPGCRFLHLPPNIRPLPIAVCDRNLRGVCTLRHRCRFFHGKKEDLDRMHAEGVTMYNPFTFEPHDPAASIDELMKLQAQTTVPLSALPPPPPPPQQMQQQPVFVVVQTPQMGGMPQAPYPYMVGPNTMMYPQMAMPFPQFQGQFPPMMNYQMPNMLQQQQPQEMIRSGNPLPPYPYPNMNQIPHPNTAGGGLFVAGQIPRFSSLQASDSQF